MPGHPFSEDISPNNLSKPPLAQPEANCSGPVIHIWQRVPEWFLMLELRVKLLQTCPQDLQPGSPLISICFHSELYPAAWRILPGSTSRTEQAAEIYPRREDPLLLSLTPHSAPSPEFLSGC